VETDHRPGLSALNFAIFSLFGTYLALPLFFAVPLLFGFVLGERWAILFALTLIPVAGAYPDLGEGGASQAMAYAALFGVPLTALAIAVGVALRNLFAGHGPLRTNPRSMR
jgi:hypothetical protein